MHLWQSALERLEDYQIRKGLIPLLWCVAKLLLLYVFVNDAMRSIWYLNSTTDPITNGHNLGIMVYTVLCFAGSLLALIPKCTLLGSFLLMVNLMAQSLYHLVTEASLSPGYEAASILGCILMIFSAEMQRRFENSQKKTGPILCDGLGFGIPGLYSRQGMLALAQFLARVGFCVINVGHAYVNYVRKGSLIMVFFNAVISIPVLVGFHTRLFAILMATVMWIGFYVNYFTLLDDDRVFLQEYVWFKFAQTTSITGGLLMLALQGPGSYSVDAARNKDD
uniref:Surfeit locus protein 4 homolog n=1 Tax=Schistocephalus solidus TaxID=70667 RepID=A0A0V0J8K2_SCHSO